MERQEAENIIASLAMISTPGKKKLRVSHAPVFYEGEEHEPGRYLIGFTATTPDKRKRAKQAVKDTGDYQLAANVARLSFGQTVKWDGSAPDFLPSKGEYVDAEVDYVEDREGNQVLRITSINKREAEAPAGGQDFSFDEEEETATEGADELQEGAQ